MLSIFSCASWPFVMKRQILKLRTIGWPVKDLSSVQEVVRIHHRRVRMDLPSWRSSSLDLWYYLQIRFSIQGLPWRRSGWESACWCGGRGFGPWSGRIPHAAEQLGPWATAAEPARLEPVLHNKRGRDGEWPPLATAGEGPRTEAKTQHS